MTQRRAAAQLGITEATLAEHLQNIKDNYLRTHPGAQADITPTHAARACWPKNAACTGYAPGFAATPQFSRGSPGRTRPGEWS